MKARELVVARYNENLDWIQDERAFVYNKGEPIANELIQYPMLNVGREAHTYLWHIVNCWNDLADWTVFCQGDNQDHVFRDMPVSMLLEQQSDMAAMIVLTGCQEWNTDGRLEHRGVWADYVASGAMRPSRWSLFEWFQEFLNLDISNWPGLSYIPGALFGVSKAVIQRRPKAFYERLLETVSDHVHPEEAYYMERSWLYIFGYPEIDLVAAAVGIAEQGNRFRLYSPVEACAV